MGAKRFCVFEYLYRDAGNFKAWGRLLLEGALTEMQVEEMRFRFDGGEYFIAEQIGVPALYQQLWEYSDGPTESDHVWHEFVALRPAEENDLAIGSPWGEATALLNAIKAISFWNERLSPHWEGVS